MIFMKIQFAHNYDSIISIENLLGAWKEFINGKKFRKDVQEFQLNLMSNIISLHNDLAAKTYRHSAYMSFNISDPKPRKIRKASVRDRLLHHAIYRKLYPFFDKTFISQSYSCRNNKGSHEAPNAFRAFAYKVSQNHKRTAWVLKCDVKKFFASIDQDILAEIIKDYIPEQDIVWLISEIVGSFYSTKKRLGLPLGNLTSQLLVNIYMTKFDQFMKHTLKAKYYIRYADDFVILSQDKKWLNYVLPRIESFLSKKLGLELHPNKVSIRTISSGIDFLGWVHFPESRVLRTTTKRRMFRGIRIRKGKTETIQSYLGLLGHGNTKKLQREVKSLSEDIEGGRVR